MRLRITTPECDGKHFVAGSAAIVSLDDVDVSRYVNKVVLTVDAEGAISADVRFFLTSADIDVPAGVTTVLGGHRPQRGHSPQNGECLCEYAIDQVHGEPTKHDPRCALVKA